jgi:hypothetical protein
LSTTGNGNLLGNLFPDHHLHEYAGDEERMNSKLAHAVAQAVEQLIELIQDVDDENPPVVINAIHINDDYVGGLVSEPFVRTHLVVWAEVYAEVYAKDRPDSVYPYKYAIYINKETCATETDGY